MSPRRQRCIQLGGRYKQVSLYFLYSFFGNRWLRNIFDEKNNVALRPRTCKASIVHGLIKRKQNNWFTIDLLHTFTAQTRCCYRGKFPHMDTKQSRSKLFSFLSGSRAPISDDQNGILRSFSLDIEDRLTLYMPDSFDRTISYHFHKAKCLSEMLEFEFVIDKLANQAIGGHRNRMLLTLIVTGYRYGISFIKSLVSLKAGKPKSSIKRHNPTCYIFWRNIVSKL